MTQKYVPDFRLYYSDETEYWLPEIVEKTGKILAFYLFDQNRPERLCSLIPDYFARFVEIIVENEIEVGLAEEIRLLGNEDVYFSSSLETVKVTGWEYEYSLLEDEEDYLALVDDMVEYYRGNSVYSEFIGTLPEGF